MILRTSAELQRLFDDRRETLRLLWDEDFRVAAEALRAPLLRAARADGSIVVGRDSARGAATDVSPEFPVEPEFFARPIAVETLGPLVAGLRLVEGANASCAQGVVTVPARGMTLGWLRMVAHEAGHARFDALHPGEDFATVLASEVAALETERRFMQTQTLPAEFAAYLAYQRAWDRVNLWARGWELREIEAGHARARPRKLWALEWASSRVGFTEVLTAAVPLVFPELGLE
ncbi:MAG: hypothetical protein KF767_07045 [Bdellovibrionaceae bacterium]|nr:hypothetical protein [Pseudobdellovibrionaceae bacterium]